VKVVIIGAGNGGCFTALHWGWFTRFDSDVEVELIYNPDISSESVGQATLIDAPNLLWAATDFNWYDNPIHATFKSGILYEGWGKVNEKIYHSFPADRMAMHYCPWEMQNLVLNCGHFKVTEGEVHPYEVDADYIVDCRGKPDDFSDYEDLKNPINACILAEPSWDTTKELWSRHVATPDGWTFVIPTHSSSPSHKYCVGYCYNSDITSKENAENNFLNMFDVNVTKHVNFKNYVAKNAVVDDRIFKNGNRLFFLEPMESSSSQAYISWVRMIFDRLYNNKDINLNDILHNHIYQLQNFVLWHYQYGSKYDTPFWDYAKTFTIDDPRFHEIKDLASNISKYDSRPVDYGGRADNPYYGQWPAYSWKCWYDGMTTVL
tara:strand:- start:76 stop:1203 length:1128 start_codon:yes stop_codon:yes gene_type:complete